MSSTPQNLDKRLYTASAVSTGGRDGRVKSDDALVQAAHQVCPYSNATRGNIVVDVRVG